MIKLAGAYMAKYMESLKKSGSYDTQQRRVILETIASSINKHSSFMEIAKKAKAIDPSIGKVTVYRTLQLFAKHDVITSYIDKRGVTRYELPIRQHIHIACDSCGKIVEIIDTGFEKTAKKMLRKKYFSGVSFTIQINARCKNCRIK